MYWSPLTKTICEGDLFQPSQSVCAGGCVYKGCLCLAMGFLHPGPLSQVFPYSFMQMQRQFKITYGRYQIHNAVTELWPL
jgi:hypothetical protein